MESESIECVTPDNGLNEGLYATYAKRKSTVEPVFGIIKSVLGYRQFMRRGLENVNAEWKLISLAWNLKRMHVLAKPRLKSILEEQY